MQCKNRNKNKTKTQQKNQNREREKEQRHCMLIWKRSQMSEKAMHRTVYAVY